VIRVVAFRKAALAGAAGALAWEAVLRGLDRLGLPLFDIVRILGTLAAPDGPAWAWWTAGMALHALVGVLWAIFYAYFFWSFLKLKPALQGLVFVLLPAALALTVMYPQFQLMHRRAEVAELDLPAVFGALGWREPAGLLLGHALYGLVLGALYTRPVGYRTGRAPPSPPRPRRPRSDPPPPPRGPHAFIFATGVEGSYPTVEHGRWRLDEFQATGWYEQWPRDLELAAEIGVTHLRWGPPLHRTLLGPDRYDWDHADQVLQAMGRAGLQPIADLCHFGLPDWLESFQNPEVPSALAAYARAFARRYPDVRFYTPVNEMYVCARLSALEGRWNEQRQDETAFVAAARHLAEAHVLMTDAVLAERPDAIVVTSESSEFHQACCPDPEVVRVADFENERRFLCLDLVYGRPLGPAMREHVRAHGLPDEVHDRFMARKAPPRSVLGVDYYEWNEKLIDAKGQPRTLGELFGWYVIASQYWDRYRLPLMHTETNRMDAREGPRWLWRQWHNVQLIRRAGVPVIGFTWYSLVDQVDWDAALAEPLGTVDPVGLFDLNRDVRTAGLAYRHLIRSFRDDPELARCPALEALCGGKA
jgi:beta-glucosidase/6-phospho-beta-glucosidase/beta-galactosidase